MLKEMSKMAGGKEYPGLPLLPGWKICEWHDCMKVQVLEIVRISGLLGSICVFTCFLVDRQKAGEDGSGRLPLMALCSCISFLEGE